MFEGMITIMTAFYAVQHPTLATVRFCGESDLSVYFTIIHESMCLYGDSEVALHADVYDFLGSDSSPKIEVEDKDVLIILAKRNDSIVGSQVFEVDLGATESGYLLIPRGGYNLLCDQQDVTCEDEQVKREVLYVIAE